MISRVFWIVLFLGFAGFAFCADTSETGGTSNVIGAAELQPLAHEMILTPIESRRPLSAKVVGCTLRIQCTVDELKPGPETFDGGSIIAHYYSPKTVAGAKGPVPAFQIILVVGCKKAAINAVKVGEEYTITGKLLAGQIFDPFYPQSPRGMILPKIRTRR